MSEMTTKVEIEDVLSSIRRLVSEDVRYARPASASGLIRDTARWTPPPAAEPLVLTPSLRVAAVQDAQDANDDDAAAADCASMSHGQADLPATRADRGLRASLEETIAELEAAITGTGGEWEPDGSEVTPAALAFEDFAPQADVSAKDAAEDEPADSADEADAGILAGMMDAAPDGPDTAMDAASQVDATPRFAADDVAPAWRDADAAACADTDPDAPADMEYAEGAAGLAAPQDEAAETLPEVIADGAADRDEIEPGPLQLVPDATGPDDDLDGLEWCAPGTPEPTPEAVTAHDDEVTKAFFFHDAMRAYSGYPYGDSTDARPASAAAAPPETDIAETAMPETAERDPAPPVAAAIAGETLRPLRRLQLSAGAEPAQPAMLRDREADAAVTSGPASAADDAGAGDDGLFGDECEVLVDEDMLRAVVAEIIRQELQGTLGERITRNVRKLVRREIQRALTAQEFD